MLPALLPSGLLRVANANNSLGSPVSAHQQNGTGESLLQYAKACLLYTSDAADDFAVV